MYHTIMFKNRGRYAVVPLKSPHLLSLNHPKRKFKDPLRHYYSHTPSAWAHPINPEFVFSGDNAG